MKQSGLGKLYDRLTPAERFALDVEAVARGDKEESELLTSTCPRETYTMTDLGFSGRWEGALQITMGTLMDLRQNTMKLRMIDAFREVLPYSDTLSQNTAAEAYLEGHGPAAATPGPRRSWTASPPATRQTRKWRRRTPTPRWRRTWMMSRSTFGSTGVSSPS